MASGGAWKVAYADFVTAMMALFMVLWISSQDKKILLATSRYFQSPFSSPLTDHSGIMPFNKESNDSSSPKSGEDESSGKEKPSDKDKQIQLNFLNSVAADFYRLLHFDENMDQKPIDVQVTSDGLRVTLMAQAKKPLFEGNTAEFTDWGRFVMQSMAWLIERHHFRVTIDGHARSRLVFKDESYGAWELSSDRANATRRMLVFYAVDASQIERVSGYGDTRPLPKEPPESEANQRIAISLALTGRQREATPALKPAAPKPAAAAPEESHSTR